MMRTVQIPVIGSIYNIPELNRRNGYEKDNRDISWEVARTETYQDEQGNLTTITSFNAVGTDAENLGIYGEKLNLDMYDNWEV